MQPALICPLCQASSASARFDDAELQANSQGAWVCPQGHTFDQAKQGYVNLLPAHFKRSKDPGDSKAMVQARRRFLTSGRYQPIADALRAAVRDVVPTESSFSVLDAGCGEGYYLRQLAAHFDAHQANWLGNDVSKWAVQAAAPWHKEGRYVVASNARLPFVDHSIDVVVCAFGFASEAEFARVLKPNGVVIKLDPSAHHLSALRDVLYTKEQAKQAATKREAPSLDGFDCTHTRIVAFDFEVDNSLLQDLIAMTPHAYRAPAQGLAAATELAELQVQASVHVQVFKPVKQVSPQGNSE